MLRVENLSVHYGDVVAVDCVDLMVAADETVALLGRSGSGKSSLLLAIAGIVPATGRVTLDDESLQQLPTHRRNVGLVFQDFALFPHLDVAANVAYGLQQTGHVEPEHASAEALEMVGLSEYGRRRIDQLSGGQAQRVALARTLATRPGALLLDEPLGSLDPALRPELAAELDALLESIGIPTIIVTHDTSEAFALGDRLAILEGGAMIAVGEPAALWGNPGSAEVARILGHHGIVSARISGGTCSADGVTLLADSDLPDGRVELLIPSGAARFDPTGVALEVIASRFNGPAWITTVRIGTGSVEVETPGRHSPGSSLGIVVDRTSVVLLDPTDH